MNPKGDSEQISSRWPVITPTLFVNSLGRHLSISAFLAPRREFFPPVSLPLLTHESRLQAQLWDLAHHKPPPCLLHRRDKQALSSTLCWPPGLSEPRLATPAPEAKRPESSATYPLLILQSVGNQLSLLLLAGLTGRFHLPGIQSPLAFSNAFEPTKEEQDPGKGEACTPVGRPLRAATATRPSQVVPASRGPRGSLAGHRGLSSECGCRGHRGGWDGGFTGVPRAAS